MAMVSRPRFPRACSRAPSPLGGTMETAVCDGYGDGEGLRVGGRSPGGGFDNPSANKTSSFNGCGRAGCTMLNGATVDIDFLTSAGSSARLAHVYSSDDVLRGLERAKHFHVERAKHFHVEWADGTPGDIDIMWGVFLVLTSDTAWGSVRTCKASETLKGEARVFMRHLLKYTCDTCDLIEDYSVVNFLLVYEQCMHHPAFARLLRGVIMAFPETLEDLSESRNTAGVHFTALQMAAEDHRVPLPVLKVLLEGNANVEHANDNGDTPLLLACYIDSDYAKDGRAELLVDYGARIDVYNLQMQNALHLMAESEHRAGMQMLLDARVQQLSRAGGRAVAQTPAARARHIRRSCAVLDPDPLHTPDVFNMTPLTSACLNENMHYKDRAAMVAMLVAAGADADEDVDLRTRTAAQGGGTPLAYGIMSLQESESEFNQVNFAVRKASQSFEIDVSLDVLVLCVDAAASVLPGRGHHPSFSLRSLFMFSRAQRFCFRPDLGGMDFDVHFDIARFPGFTPRFRKSPAHEAQFVACVRMPRGPCQLTVWTHEMDEAAVLEMNVFPDRQYTLAHHAAACRHPDTRRRAVLLAQTLCNPLRRCSEGLTAADTLAGVVRRASAAAKRAPTAVSGSGQWALVRLLKGMRQRERVMQEYIHRDAQLLVDGAAGTAAEQAHAVAPRDKKCGKKRRRWAVGSATDTSSTTPTATTTATTTTTTARTKPSFVSPFSLLPDDVCGRIIGFI